MSVAMLNMKKVVCLITAAASILCFSSCGIITITPIDRPGDVRTEELTDAATEEKPRFTLVLSDEADYADEYDRRASVIIDAHIKKAVVLLNSMSERPHFRLKKLSETEQKIPERDKLRYDLSKTVYDDVLSAALGFGRWTIRETDYPSVSDMFNIVVSATDALRIDRPEIFLYCDVKSYWENGGFVYTLAYYFPNEWLTHTSDDIDGIRDRVLLYNAVVERIIRYAPPEADDFYRCCYYIFLISSVCSYETAQLTVFDQYQAYNVFINGSAVCHGYADALVELCTRSGIFCDYVSGEAPSEGPHAWNRLLSDEGELYVDVTWYDRDSITDNFRQGKTSYLFMTKEEMLDEGYVPK
ncbi:MAG: hypothetical protein IJU75_03925 [Clostridia bacterium]|nr:hypothetical protein [Clostridia bacterium]